VTPIVHHPFVIPLPFWPHEVTGFGLAVLLAFVIAQIVSQQELLRRGYQKEADAIPDLILACVLGTLVGGKLYYAGIVMQDWSALWGRAGFVFWGGFIGSVIACWIVIQRKNLNFARFSDVAGIAIAAGYSVGRTGCWAVGDDYGKPWSGPLSVMFPEGAPPSTAANMNRIFGTPIPDGVSPDTVLAVHPTQLYETALGFLMFLVLWRFRGHRHAEGWLFGMYLVLAGAERFFIEFFRAKDDRFAMGLTLAQIIALLLAVTGVIVMTMRSRSAPPEVRAAA
jgi:phosphatidylglycerol---prolipoprotein diacylglyceryl transferase